MINISYLISNKYTNKELSRDRNKEQQSVLIFVLIIDAIGIFSGGIEFGQFLVWTSNYI